MGKMQITLTLALVQVLLAACGNAMQLPYGSSPMMMNQGPGFMSPNMAHSGGGFGSMGHSRSFAGSQQMSTMSSSAMGMSGAGGYLMNAPAYAQMPQQFPHGVPQYVQALGPFFQFRSDNGFSASSQNRGYGYQGYDSWMNGVAPYMGDILANQQYQGFIANVIGFNGMSSKHGNLEKYLNKVMRKRHTKKHKKIAKKLANAFKHIARHSVYSSQMPGVYPGLGYSVHQQTMRYSQTTMQSSHMSNQMVNAGGYGSHSGMGYGPSSYNQNIMY